MAQFSTNLKGILASTPSGPNTPAEMAHDGSGNTAIIGLKAINPIAWWDILGQQFPSISQWAFGYFILFGRSDSGQPHSTAIANFGY
jgi:hypothetical protein